MTAIAVVTIIVSYLAVGAGTSALVTRAVFTKYDSIAVLGYFGGVFLLFWPVVWLVLGTGYLVRGILR